MRREHTKRSIRKQGHETHEKGTYENECYEPPSLLARNYRHLSSEWLQEHRSLSTATLASKESKAAGSKQIKRLRLCRTKQTPGSTKIKPVKKNKLVNRTAGGQRESTTPMKKFSGSSDLENPIFRVVGWNGFPRTVLQKSLVSFRCP